MKKHIQQIASTALNVIDSPTAVGSLILILGISAFTALSIYMMHVFPTI